MEANPPGGNRVFGASGPRHEQLKINPATGAVDPVNGKIIAPRHIHAALRKYLGIQTDRSEVPPEGAGDREVRLLQPGREYRLPEPVAEALQPARMARRFNAGAWITMRPLSF